MDRIDEIYTESPEYGYRYIYHQLIEEGDTIGRDRTLKYMCLMGLSKEKEGILLYRINPMKYINICLIHIGKHQKETDRLMCQGLMRFGVEI